MSWGVRKVDMERTGFARVAQRKHILDVHPRCESQDRGFADEEPERPRQRHLDKRHERSTFRVGPTLIAIVARLLAQPRGLATEDDGAAGLAQEEAEQDEGDAGDDQLDPLRPSPGRSVARGRGPPHQPIVCGT